MKTVVALSVACAILASVAGTPVQAQAMAAQTDPSMGPATSATSTGGPAAPVADYAPVPTTDMPGEPGTTPAQIRALRDGDNALVTNGPVPDTPANRAKFGGPRSHGGKKTAPAGN
jgi:hypothetical protein